MKKNVSKLCIDLHLKDETHFRIQALVIVFLLAGNGLAGSSSIYSFASTVDKEKFKEPISERMKGSTPVPIPLLFI